jgi:hypothetical protein
MRMPRIYRAAYQYMRAYASVVWQLLQGLPQTAAQYVLPLNVCMHGSAVQKLLPPRLTHSANVPLFRSRLERSTNQ